MTASPRLVAWINTLPPTWDEPPTHHPRGARVMHQTETFALRDQKERGSLLVQVDLGPLPHKDAQTQLKNLLADEASSSVELLVCFDQKRQKLVLQGLFPHDTVNATGLESILVWFQTVLTTWRTELYRERETAARQPEHLRFLDLLAGSA